MSIVKIALCKSFVKEVIMIPTDEQCEDLLKQIDNFATYIDSYEYGLPIHFGTPNLSKLIEIVKIWCEEVI